MVSGISILNVIVFRPVTLPDSRTLEILSNPFKHKSSVLQLIFLQPKLMVLHLFLRAFRVSFLPQLNSISTTENCQIRFFFWNKIIYLGGVSVLHIHILCQHLWVLIIYLQYCVKKELFFKSYFQVLCEWCSYLYLKNIVGIGIYFRTYVKYCYFYFIFL